MDILLVSLVLLLAVIVSSWTSRALPFAVPLPIVQILIGIGIAEWTSFSVTIDPAFFFAFFIPALLYLEGWRIPKDDLSRDGKAVLGMAVGLVFLTVVGLGFFINWLIPTIPLYVAFALAGILSPTDPVAVSGITSRLPMPKRLLHILEGESLLNDASGLSVFKIACAAMVTGHFSFEHAVSEFVSMSMGGALVGVMVCWVMLGVQNTVSLRIDEDAGSKTLLSILIPFAAYFGAEIFHFSGVLAAATAGIYMAFAEMRGSSLASTRMQRSAVWDMIAFTMNGVIFVILGEQFPAIIDGAAQVMREAGTQNGWVLLGYVLAITGALLSVRFLWTGLTFWSIHKKSVLAGTTTGRFSLLGPAIATAAGVRGSITLAGIMTMPYVIEGGERFPARDLAVFLAAGVIVTTLIIAWVLLPFLLRNGAKHALPEDVNQEAIAEARVTAAKSAIQRIEARLHSLSEGRSDADIYTEAGARAMEVYRQKIDSMGETDDHNEDERTIRKIERTLLMAGMDAERETLFQLGQQRKISDAAVRKLVHPIDLSEARLREE